LLAKLASQIKSPAKPQESAKGKLEKKPEPLKMKVGEISATGDIVFSFNRPVSINPAYFGIGRRLDEENDFYRQAIAGAFKIDYLPKTSGGTTTQMYGFNVTEFKDNQVITIQINFTDPLYVSADSESNSASSKDKIICSLDESIFYDDVANQPLPKNLLKAAKMPVPKQLPKA